MVRTVAAAFLVTALFGCSSSDDTAHHPSSSSASGGTSSSDGGTDDGSTSSGEAAAPKAPKIEAVGKMMGALHVMWVNEEPACDTIEGERRAQMASGATMEDFKVVFTVPGEADNKHDTSATKDMKYTYRLRCKKGSTYSDYSNEMSGNPVQ